MKTCSFGHRWVSRQHWKIFLGSKNSFDEMFCCGFLIRIKTDWTYSMAQTMVTDHYFRRANGSLLPPVKLRQTEEDNADDTKDVNENIHKPDWAVFASISPVVTILGALEMKIAYKRNPGCVFNYVKLAKEMKLILHQLINLGVVEPIACGILIQGSECETFAKDLLCNGVYRFIKLSKTDLCLSFQQLPLFPHFFQDMMCLRAFALKVAYVVKERHANRHLGKETQGKTSVSWLRKSIAKIERISLS